jgi:E3 ubiquitin-protein ligase HERC3
VGECGGLWSCGRGRHGQLGQGHFHDVGPLQRVEVLRGVRVRSAAAGAAHSLVLTAGDAAGGGGLWSWGDNRHGQCALGSRAAAVGQPWPTRVEINSPNPASVTAISAGGHHSLVVNADGGLFAAGRGRHGALGLGNSYSRRVLVPVVRPRAPSLSLHRASDMAHSG